MYQGISEKSPKEVNFYSVYGDLCDQIKAKNMEELDFREMNKETDTGWISTRFLQNYEHNGFITKRLRNDIYWHHMNQRFKSLMLKPSIRALMCHPRGDLNTLLGYMLYEICYDNLTRKDQFILHWVFIVPALRKIGLATKLSNLVGMKDYDRVYFTTWPYYRENKDSPDLIEILIDKHKDQWLFDPYRL